ncbi:MAG: hypothetical protein ACFN4I_06475, partial [Campylobacter concisus]
LTQITKTTLCDGVAALMREARNETLVQTKSCEQNIALSFDGFKVSENKIFSINDFLKQMGVELDFSALLDELEAKILSKSEPDDEALLSLRQNLLNNKSISQFCEMLAEHEKKLLKERVKAYEMSQKETLNQRLLVLNKKLNELNLQNQSSISKLKQKTSLQDEICSLLEDIKNV